MGAPRRLAWIAVLVVGVLLFEAVRRALVSTQNPNLLPALILLGAAVVPAAFVTFIAGRRLSVDVHGGALALVAVIGGVVGVVAAGVLEFDTVRRLGTMPMVAVGLIEEGAKLLVPIALVLAVQRWRRPSDGLLVGVASGAGFAALETMGYAFVVLIQTRGSLDAVDGVLVLRGLLSPAAHMAWTGLTTAALWQAAARGWSAAGLLRLLGPYVLAVALHTAWDSVGSFPGYVVVAALSLGLLLAVTHHLSVRDRGAPLAAAALAR